MSSRKGGKRDDSYFAADRRRRNKTIMIAVPIVASIILLAIIGAYAYQNGNPYGVVGSAHEHAAFAIKLDGEQIDFSQSKYQVKSRYIHVENGDGTTLHRHATDVPFGEFLKSVKMDIKDGCFIMDDGRQFCNDSSKTLKYFVNGTQLDSITGYVLNKNDHILVIYGNETDAQIRTEIDALQQVVPKG